MRVSACVFDLDGTILNDELAYGKAFNEILRSLGINSTEPYPQKGGVGVEANWKYLIAKYGIKTDKSPQELSVLTQVSFRNELSQIKVKAGFYEFVERLREMKILTALSTSNTRETVDLILQRFDLYDLFDVVVTLDEVPVAKPDPALFLAAAQKLGVDASDCLVFEDSQAGIEAAHRAGMRVCVMKNSRNKTEKLTSADHQLTNFKNPFDVLGEYFRD